MFIHNLKYTIKILFKNKVLIFWTFAFPIILGLLFNMAFSNIEKDEMLKVFSIAVVSNDNSKEQEIYKETLEKLSTGDARLFNLKYVAEEEANRLLDESEIEGYVVISDDVKVVIKENGSNQTIIKFVIQEIKQNKKIVEDLSLKEIEKETSNGNYSFDTTEIVNNILTKL